MSGKKRSLAESLTGKYRNVTGSPWLRGDTGARPDLGKITIVSSGQPTTPTGNGHSEDTTKVTTVQKAEAEEIA